MIRGFSLSVCHCQELRRIPNFLSLATDFGIIQFKDELILHVRKKKALPSVDLGILLAEHASIE